MAKLPSSEWLMQQHGNSVILFSALDEDDEIVRFDPRSGNDTARAQRAIHTSKLSDEDKCFAHFWSGYFYAHAHTGYML